MRYSGLYFIVSVVFFASCITKSENATNTNTIIYDTVDLALVHNLKKSCMAIPDTGFARINGVKLQAGKQVKEFYNAVKYTSFFTRNYFPHQRAAELLSLISNSHYYGLHSETYDISKLRNLYLFLNDSNYSGNRLKLATEFEILYANSTFLFMSHLHRGKLPQDTLVFGNVIDQFPDSFFTKLIPALSDSGLTQTVLNVQPQFSEYVYLQKALETYLKTNKLSKQKLQLPHFKTDSVKCYTKVKHHFLQQNYIKKYDINYTLFAQNAMQNILNYKEKHTKKTFSMFTWQNTDSVFIYSLKMFQDYNGLNPDGKIGEHTWNALQKSSYENYMQIAATLERMRWEHGWNNEYVLVNIPSYTLRAYKNNAPEIQLKIVAGKPKTATPTLSSIIKYFIIYPEWHVPYSITANELLPKLRKDSSYLRKNNYRLVSKEREIINAEAINWTEMENTNMDYRIVQQSGSKNALGIIKFIFDNPYSVYIHDTPSKKYFAHDVRAYSHGCMRLENPTEFANFLLSKKSNKAERDSFPVHMTHLKRRYYYLEQPLQIHVRYYTALGNVKGELFIYKDVYNNNSRIISQLFK